MEGNVLLKYLYSGLVLAASSHPVAAQSASESEITVLASARTQTLASTGESIAVFTREDMDRVQGADLSRLLERSPGVLLSRNGPPGNFTAVRVRGAEGEQLLVLAAGVRPSDPAAPGGGFDVGILLMGTRDTATPRLGSHLTIRGS